VPAIKAFRVRGADFADQIDQWLSGVPAGVKRPCVLLDAYDKSARGGTGKTFNWELVVEARRAGRLEEAGPVILAGGLNPDNVAEAVRKVRPWGVDVASGVEVSPGRKDFAAVEAFIERAQVR
jgi:phosphoribosylanthranilate isomerase